jgi:hypothetical protein
MAIVLMSMAPTRDPILAIAVMLGWLLWILFSGLAHAHDPKRPDLDKWFDGLTSNVLCCDKKEVKELDDSDWDTQDGHYRVRLNGNWYVVPDAAVVKEPNKMGRALLWFNGVIIRCFLPGTWS